MHLHCNNLGNPGNYTDTLDSFKLAEGYTPKNNFGRDQVDARHARSVLLLWR